MEPPTANPSGATAGRHVAPTMPPHPLTLDGSAVLHQVFRMRWPQWNALASDHRAEIARQASLAFEALESDPGGGSAVFSQLGHRRTVFDGMAKDVVLAVGQAERLAIRLQPVQLAGVNGNLQ